MRIFRRDELYECPDVFGEIFGDSHSSPLRKNQFIWGGRGANTLKERPSAVAAPP